MTATTASTNPFNSRLTAFILLGAVAAIWGATFFVIKDATATFSVLAFMTIRFAIASIALLPFVLSLRRWPNVAELRWGVGAGVLFTFGYIFQTFALRLADSGRVGFITGLYVVLVPLLALVLLRYRLKLRIIIATALALGGLTLLSYAPGGSFAGDLLAFLCALSFAGQIVLVEKFPKHTDWRYMAILQTICVALFCALLLPLMSAIPQCRSELCVVLQPFSDQFPTDLPLKVLGVAAFTGLLASAFGLWVQIWAQKILPPSDAALIYALESPFAAIFGVMMLGERLTFGAIVGCVLLSLSMVVMTVAGNQPTDRPSRRILRDRKRW